jgi:hypothetical protein
MAGTSWDRLGQTGLAFELVAPVLRRVADAEGARLHEFFRDDPVWRLDLESRTANDVALDVSWSEERPEEYGVNLIWWEDGKLQRQEVGTFTRDRPLDELETMLLGAASRFVRRT